MRDNLLRNPTRITANTCWIQAHRPVEPPEPAFRDSRRRRSRAGRTGHRGRAAVWARRGRYLGVHLPPRYRAVIELRHFQELSYEEIAATLNRPLSDVKSDLFRARKLLAQQLTQVT